jgi:hypothetical protein
MGEKELMILVSEEEFAALEQKVEQMVEELNESLRRLVHRVETLEGLIVKGTTKLTCHLLGP